MPNFWGPRDRPVFRVFCVFRGYNTRGGFAAVREILSIPDGFMPLNVIPVGYPAENPPAKDKWNPAKIHYDKW